MPNKGMIQRNHSWLAILQRLVDVFTVFALLWLLCDLFNQEFSRTYQLAAVLGASFAWIFMGGLDVYRPWRASALWSEVRIVLLSWVYVFVCLLLIAWITKSMEAYSRIILSVWIVLTPAVLVLWHVLQRVLLRSIRKQGKNRRKVVIVGAGDLGRKLAERINVSEWMGLELLGFFDDDAQKKGSELMGFPILGESMHVYHFVKQHHVDRVYFALPMTAQPRIKAMYEQLQDTTASLLLIPDIFIFDLLGARQHDIAGLPVYSLCETPLVGPYGLLKRIEDVVLAALILLFISPVMLVIALAIKSTSKGPIIFQQHRYGLNGESIKVYKFRSMTTCDNDATIIKQAGKNDSRITPLGGFLRRTSLDELPQFVNVLQGRMSVVGPRPHAVAHNEQYRKLIKGYMWRHKVKPGITGWAQINGWRGETDTLEKMEKRVEYDLDYIREWSLWLDLKIVFLTIFKGFFHKNAY